MFNDLQKEYFRIESST